MRPGGWLDPKPSVLRKAPFAISLAVVLASCGEKWSISQVLVNPQPLSPDPVTPVVLVAPPTCNPTAARCGLPVEVDFEIEVKRDAGFQSPIDIFAPPRPFNPDDPRTSPPFRLAEWHPALAHAVMAPLICWSLSSSMLRYLFVDHAVPAMWRSLAAARLSAD
jgi:hypothetical protein